MFFYRPATFIYFFRKYANLICVCVCREAESSVCAQTNTTAGYLQAVDSAGTPLCLTCQKPSGEHRGWAGGFCSPACMEDFQLRSNQGYMRARVLETEQGVCQHCGLNAHQLYVQVRDAPHTHRKEILDNTWLAQLPLKQVGLISRSLICIFLSVYLIYLSIAEILHAKVAQTIQCAYSGLFV